MLRRVIIILIGLAALAGVIAVGGTLILRSNWLAQQVLADASEQLGLEVGAESFSLSWGGRATLSELRVRMPLSEEVVLSADRLELELSAIPLIIFGWPIEVHSVAIDRPSVFLRQYENGRWNVQAIWARVQASLPPAPPRGRRIKLPQVVVRDATIRITESDATVQTVGPIQFDGRRQRHLGWEFDLRAPPVAQIEGRVIEGRDWAHEVQFAVQEIESLVRIVLGQDLAPIHLAGRWQGSVRQDTLVARVQFDDLAVARAALEGGLWVEATSDHVMLSPRGLRVAGLRPSIRRRDAFNTRGQEARDTPERGEVLELTDGAVRVSREQVAVEFVTVKAGPLGGRIAGHWEPQARRGEFSGSWVADWPDQAAHANGTYQFTMKSPREGRREAQVNMTAQARTALGAWHAIVEARGGGAHWPMSQWQIQVPSFSWSHGKRQVDVAQAAAQLDLRWPEIRLVSLSLPEATRVDAEARLDAQTRQWSAQLAVEQVGCAPHTISSPSQENRYTLHLGLSVEGDDEQARVQELRVALNETVITAKGDISFLERGLQNVHLEVDWLAHDPRPGPARVQQPPGRWRLEANLTGQIQPLLLEAQATLAGQNVAVGRRWVDRVQVPVYARMDARQVDATTPPFDLLDGQWQLAGRHELSGQITQVHVLATDLSLGAIASMVGLPLASEGQARGEIKLRMPGFDLEEAVATGSWSAQDVHLPPLAVQRAEGALRIAGGSVRLGHIRLEQEDGLVRADLDFRLEEPEVVSIELAAQNWPLRLEEQALSLVVDGRTKLRANLRERTGDGEARLASRIMWQHQEVADLRLVALVEGQTVDVRELHAQMLGGSAEGTARISLNRWIDSVAHVRWQGIQPGQLQAWLPPLARLEGTMSGSLAVEQTGARLSSFAGDALRVTSDTQTRPLGPMRFLLEADLAQGRFGPAQIGPWRVVGYLDPNRLLVQDASFDVLEGRLEARARVSRREGRFYGSVVADFNDLNLEQLVHAVDPNAGTYVGRLSGSAAVLPVFNDGISLSGEGRIRVSQSDLVGSHVVRTLYDTLNLRFGPREPTGTGDIRVQFQGPAVVLSSVQYFNRGVEMRGAGEIQNVNLGADSPVEGYAVASTRILAGIKLPAIGALDRILGAFQTDAASVRIGGVLDNVQVQVVPLPEVLGPFRRLLWAQLRE